MYEMTEAHVMPLENLMSKSVTCCGEQKVLCHTFWFVSGIDRHFISSPEMSSVF